MDNVIPYYRVSTNQQERSGLGLEAQQDTIHGYADKTDLKILNEFIEVESGKRKRRPILNLALETCVKDNARLIIATLDRLGRSVAFISRLMESKVQFIVVDNPNADEFTLHILASVAEKQAKDISINTKAALQAAKKRGVILGRYGSEVLSQKNKLEAWLFAQKMIPVIKAVKERGFKTIREITSELNRSAIPPFSGAHATWHIHSVHNLLKRITVLDNASVNSLMQPATT